MPLFTFECRDCEATFEELVSFSQSAKDVTCPDCRSENTQKQLSRVARMAQSVSSGSSFSIPASACAPGGT